MVERGLARFDRTGCSCNALATCSPDEVRDEGDRTIVRWEGETVANARSIRESRGALIATAMFLVVPRGRFLLAETCGCGDLFFPSREWERCEGS